MAYTVPSADDLIERFPEFEDVDSDLLDRVIADAALQVDTTWLEADYARAILYLAAHLLSVSTAQSDGESTDDIASEHIGRISVTYRGSTAASSSLGSTTYGEQFVLLRRLNHPAIKVV